jgi:hypothetical protein
MQDKKNLFLIAPTFGGKPFLGLDQLSKILDNNNINYSHEIVHQFITSSDKEKIYAPDLTNVSIRLKLKVCFRFIKKKVYL